MSKRGNGEGTIYYSEKLNRWVAQFYINNKRISKYGKTRKEVKEKMLQTQSEELNGTYIEKEDITVYQLANEIIEDNFNSNTIGENTYKRYQYTLSYIKYSKLGNLKIQNVTSKDIKDFLNNKTNYSNSVIAKIYQLLTRTFNRAISREYIIKNPMNSEEVKKPKSDNPDKEVSALSIEEEKALINAVITDNSPYSNIILLMLFTGMRIGEALALTLDNIDIENNTIKITTSLTRDKNDKVIQGKTTKTKNSKRTINISPTINQILINSISKNIKNKNNLLFFDDNGIITPSEINSYLIRLNHKYNIAPKLHNHILRHTFATRCIESGMNLKVISKKLGHAKIQTTLDIYASILNQYEETEDDKLNNYLQANGIGLH